MIPIDWFEFRASVQRALLFNIRPSVVCISIALLENNECFMRFQFDNEPTEDDKDMCFAAAGEVAGDFVHMKDCKVSFITSNPVYAEGEHLPTLAYARAEAEY